MAGPRASFESYNKDFWQQEDAENIHRARNRVTRPEIAENMSKLEDMCTEWKKTEQISRNFTLLILWTTEWSLYYLTSCHMKYIKS